MLSGHRLRSRLPDAILGASTGLWHGASVFLLRPFTPASRVAVAEAFLARRVGVVPRSRSDEEPAQRPQEAPDGTWSLGPHVRFSALGRLHFLRVEVAPHGAKPERAPIRGIRRSDTARCVAAMVRAAAPP